MSNDELYDYITMHREGLRDYIEPYLTHFLEGESEFADMPEQFQEGYQEHLTHLVYQHLENICNVSYEQLQETLSFETLTEVLGLDENGRI